MTSDIFSDAEDREIDPAVFDPPRRPVGRPPRPAWQPSAQQRREATQRAARERAGRRLAVLYYEHAGDAPFTVQTMLSIASTFPELRAELLVVAPDRAGLGVPSRNMLTRWFTAQEHASIGPDSRFSIERLLGTVAIWRYLPLPEVSEEF